MPADAILFDRRCYMMYNTATLCSRRSDSRPLTPRCPAPSAPVSHRPTGG